MKSLLFLLGIALTALVTSCQTAPRDPAVRAANRAHVEQLERQSPVTPIPDTPIDIPPLHDGPRVFGRRPGYGYW